MNVTRLCTRTLFAILLSGALASCSKDDSTITGPGPPPPPPPGDADGYFVNAATGHDDSAGTKAAPFKTIRRAITAARPTGVDVFVAKGSYTEGSPGLQLQDKVSLFGGYDGTTWQRNPAQHVSEIIGASEYSTVDGTHADSLALDGFTIRSPDQTTPGVSSVCIRVAGLFNGIVISNNILIAGKGADGADGETIVVLSGAGNGGNGVLVPNQCLNIGGAGGTSAVGYPGGAGGVGGALDGYPGSNALGSDATSGYGGAGGTLLSREGKNGGHGRNGEPGTHGQAGTSLGVLHGSGYGPSSGTNGTRGTVGYGGGGGGGGFGTGVACGGGGGGGGGGGRAGGEGTGGGGGGGSFGIVISGQGTVQILNNRITTGNGGEGGAAGEGEAGNGGVPGSGGHYPLWAPGGDGGGGGRGGNGGWGGPGGGGPSIGIAEGSLASTTRTGNVITIGTPGAGGTTLATGRPNAPAGIALDYKKFN